MVVMAATSAAVVAAELLEVVDSEAAAVLETMSAGMAASVVEVAGPRSGVREPGRQVTAAEMERSTSARVQAAVEARASAGRSSSVTADR
jgi:hypothetical protein